MGLSKRRADKLRRRATGTGRRARWACRRLVEAGDAGDPVATDALWDLWLHQGSAEIWAALSRWRRPRTGGGLSLVALKEKAPDEDVIKAAKWYGHPLARIATATIAAGDQALVEAVCDDLLSTEDEYLAWVCAEHHLAPADPHRAALFFLLTGQREQYRLADPDHSLLALAYQAGGAEERARIQRGVAGEPDLVRVLADTLRRDRMAGLTPGETRYLIDGFAQRRDWPTLWALAKDLPVHQAIDAVRRIEGWRPGPADAALFDTLARADADVILEAHDTLRTSWSRSLPVRGTPVDASFSPDGTRFAVATEYGVDVLTWPEGRLEPQNSRLCTGIRAVLALEDGVIVTAGHDEYRLRTGFVERGGGGRPLTRQVFPGVVTALARRPGGFAALTVTGGNAWLRLQDDDGREGELPKPRTLSARGGIGNLDPDAPEVAWTMAGDPDGRLAVAGVRLCLLGTGARARLVVGARQFATGRRVVARFAGAGRIIAADDSGTARLWQETENGGWTVAAVRQLDQDSDRTSLVHLAARGEIAMVEHPGWVVQYLNAATLADVTDRRPVDTTEANTLFATPDGSQLVLGRRGAVQVVDVSAHAMIELADRPLGATTPVDLHTVAGVLDRTPPDSPARPVLELLRVCLEHRFGADVTLGADGSLAGAPDDIALGGA